MKQSPLLHDTELIVWFLLTDISRLFRQLVDEETRPLRMTRNQWYTIAHIYYWEGLNQQDLAKLLDMSKSSTARMMQDLEKKKWIKRKTDSEDKRAWLVVLAPGMKKIVRDLTELARISFQHTFRGLNEKKSGELIAHLREIESGLEKRKDKDAEAEIKALRASITPRLRKLGANS